MIWRLRLGEERSGKSRGSGRKEMAILRALRCGAKRRPGPGLHGPAYCHRTDQEAGCPGGGPQGRAGGGLRRRQETVASGDILVLAEEPAPILAVCELPIIEQVKQRQEDRAKVLWTSA